MNKESVKIINDHQKSYYEKTEERVLSYILEKYSSLLNRLKSRKTLKILDIGGANGRLAIALKEYFSNINCEIYVVDTTEYDSWTKYADKVTFIKTSADNLVELFETDSFDLVFANRVFHHLVRRTWKSTVLGMSDVMRQIASILKKDGFFCIVEIFCTGYLFNNASSKIIYILTSCKLPLVVALCRKFKAESAGTGVCFLPKKTWLTLFSQAGFVVNSLQEDKQIKLSWYKRLFLLNKNISSRNAFILQINVNFEN
jgi:ubiquinone/menaquinone biosynthesis C-methylase UbiE